MNDNAKARINGILLSIAHKIGLFLAMTVICLPGLWIVLASFRPTVEIMAKPPVWIPQDLSFDAYVAMFSGVGQGGIPVIEYFRNSLIISVTSTAIALALGMAGGYAFARFRFRAKSSIFLGLDHLHVGVGQGDDVFRDDRVAVGILHEVVDRFVQHDARPEVALEDRPRRLARSESGDPGATREGAHGGVKGSVESIRRDLDLELDGRLGGWRPGDLHRRGSIGREAPGGRSGPGPTGRW